MTIRTGRVGASLAAWALLTGLCLSASGCGSHSSTPVHPPPSEPTAGTWKTWVLPSSDAIRVPPPPTASSPAAHAELSRLRALADRRTADETAAFREAASRPALTQWLELNMHLERVFDPPMLARQHALLSVAMYDATVAAWHWKYVYRRAAPEDVDALMPPGRDPSYPSEDAAIAGAAARVLDYEYPGLHALDFEALAREAGEARVRAGVNYPSDVRAGLALGRAVAAKVIARAKHDGSTLHWHGRPPAGPAYWKPPPGDVSEPVSPMAGKWRPWVLRSGNEFRAPPPPRYGSARFLAETREILRISDHLTPAQRQIAIKWAGGLPSTSPPTIWEKIALAQLQRARLSVPRQARTMALVDVAVADSGIATWDTKYAYWQPRPDNAVADLGLRPGWSPLIPTPHFPAYISGHATFSAAAATVLGHLFPARARRFHAEAEEAAISRLYGGIHFRSDDEVGQHVGAKVGRLVVAHARRDGAER